MNRRRFLGACIATLAAPAIVRASSLMPGRAIGSGGSGWGESQLSISGLNLLQHAQNEATNKAMAALAEDWNSLIDDYYVVVNPQHLVDLDLRPVWRLDPPGKIIPLERVLRAS